MTITYQSDTFDTLGYGIIYHRPHEKACAEYVAREIQRIFGLPQTIDEDEDAVYIEIDDRHLFYGEIQPYFYRAISRYYATRKDQ